MHGSGNARTTFVLVTLVTAHPPALAANQGPILIFDLSRKWPPGGTQMKKSREVVQEEIQFGQMLNDPARESHVALRELQRVLLSALYLVNRLQEEMPAQPTTTRISGKDIAPERLEVEHPEAKVAPAVSPTYSISEHRKAEGSIGEGSPRDIP